jgi:transketolase
MHQHIEPQPPTISFGRRRGVRIDLSPVDFPPPDQREVHSFELLDLLYRSLCTMLYNYAPMSGHPGGSISSGRFVQSILFRTAEYDLSDPDRPDADIISYAAGHKALGLYAIWALRNEIARLAAPQLLPADPSKQLRLEDLLGFRRNPVTATPLFRKFGAKALDGHPTPATPFVKLATGASGVGVASSFGYALAGLDVYPNDPPRVHVVEGEGGLTPGRVAEALAFAGTSRLSNVILHLDWNQASIDSNRVTREGDQPGDYVQWDPMELFYLHDWNVIYVSEGHDFPSIFNAQQKALELDNGQPTAIVYRTVKGWQYGMEGRASHGAGHKLCSAGFYDALYPLMDKVGAVFPACEPEGMRCREGSDATVLESCFWSSLGIIRRALEENRDLVGSLAGRLRSSRHRLITRKRTARPGAPAVQRIFDAADQQIIPEELSDRPYVTTTLRGQLGKVLGYFNRISNGAVLVAAADLLGSTSILEASRKFPEGFFDSQTNRGARTLAVGGICEDAISGVLSGISTFGFHLAAGSSYGAFIAPLSHIAARLHAIGGQARKSTGDHLPAPMIVICGHAGLKTGEDGPTHADPQPLQLLQENFPKGTMITLTPWDPREIYPLLTAALRHRPAVIAPFVTRPNELVLDRTALKLAPASAAVSGVYQLRRAKGASDGTIVLQESGVTYAFLQTALPLLERDGIDLDVYYVASAELFDLLPVTTQRAAFPELAGFDAMGITGFTLSTMYRWIRSELGRELTMHPFQNGHFLGSGKAEAVLQEAGLDGESQYKRIVQYVGERRRAGRQAVTAQL